MRAKKIEASTLCPSASWLARQRSLRRRAPLQVGDCNHKVSGFTSQLAGPSLQNTISKRSPYSLQLTFEALPDLLDAEAHSERSTSLPLGA